MNPTKQSSANPLILVIVLSSQLLNCAHVASYIPVKVSMVILVGGVFVERLLSNPLEGTFCDSNSMTSAQCGVSGVKSTYSFLSGWYFGEKNVYKWLKIDHKRDSDDYNILI